MNKCQTINKKGRKGLLKKRGEKIRENRDVLGHRLKYGREDMEEEGDGVWINYESIFLTFSLR